MMSVMAGLCVAMAILVGAQSSDWGRLSSLRPARKLPQPFWLQPIPGAMPTKTRALVASGAGLATLLVPVPAGWWTLPVAALSAGAVFVALGRFERASVKARRERLRDQLPDACDLLSEALSAGVPMHRAVQLVAGLSPPETAEVLDGVIAQVDVGVSMRSAWQLLGDDPVWGRVAQAVARTIMTGAGLGEIVSQLGEEQRAQRQQTRIERARATGVRAVLPVTVCFLPAFLLVGVVPTLASTLQKLLG